MADALTVQAHSTIKPPPQTQDRFAAAKLENQNAQAKPSGHSVSPATAHKVDITA